MNRKKIVTLVFIVLVVVLGVWYFNCSSCNVADGSSEVLLATGGTKGTYFTVGGAIANAVNKGGKLKVISETGNASVANIINVADKKVDFGIAQADIAYWAYNGERMFTDAPVKKVRAICALYPEHIQLLVTKRANINTFTDLKDKRVGVGAHESGTEGDVDALLQQAGFSMGDDIKTAFLDFATITTLFRNYCLDAGFIVAGIPTEPVAELFESDLKENSVPRFSLLSFDDAFLAKLHKAYPFMVPSVIPAGTYAGLPETKTPAIMSFIVTSEDTDDKVVYDFLEALYNNIDIVQSVHAKGKEITLETATQGLTIPLHPAAEKFFKDKGILK